MKCPLCDHEKCDHCKEKLPLQPTRIQCCKCGTAAERAVWETDEKG